MEYTLGLDIGTNSIGWAILKLNNYDDPQSIIKLGCRIFTDGRNPKDNTTLASKRRQKRHERRRYDRLAQRKKLVINQLITMGLFPKNEEDQQELKKNDVLRLRADAVKTVLKPFELGRVIYHLSLRRGFKSNRKNNLIEDKVTKITERINKLKAMLIEDGYKSVGDFLYARHEKGLSTKATIENNFHLLRQLIEDEFDKIVELQKSSYKNISNEQWSKLRGRIFHQRPLRLVDTGQCAIYDQEKRTYKYAPSFENYRFLVELFNLNYQDSEFKTHTLTNDQILKVYNEFSNLKEVTYVKIKKLLKLSSELKFNMEKDKIKIKISDSNYLFSSSHLFGDKWNILSLEQKDRIALTFFGDDEPDLVASKLNELSVPEDVIKNLPLNPPAVSEITCSYSSLALQKIVNIVLNEMRHPTLVANDLIESHILESNDRLSYYGKTIPESTQPIPQHIKDSGANINLDEKQFGRIANPTVHTAMRQIQKVVNELIEVYGKPKNIHIEFARDLKLTKKEKDRLKKTQNDNKKRNEEILSFIDKYQQKRSAFNIERVRLWLELNAMNNQVCVYSGKTISQRMVLSDEVQVDHILPFSRTLDDGINNKVLVIASENQFKKNRTPYEAYSKNPIKWAEIQERAKYLPVNKQWRFSEDAILKFEKESDFLSRHLNDTRHISKVAKKYLTSIIEDRKILTSKGALTALLRGKLGLAEFIKNADGTKNRDDHRHHAIDALTVALTSRSYLKRVAEASGDSSEKKGLDKILVSQPWDGFIDEVRLKFGEIIVSHKVDHDRNGSFMEDTCFSLVKNMNSYEKKNNFKLVTTKTVDSLNEKNIKNIRDINIRRLAAEKGIAELPKEIKKLRVYEVSKDVDDTIGTSDSTLAMVRHGKKKQHVKIYKKGENNHLAIWFLPKNILLKKDNYKKRKLDYIFTPIKTVDLNFFEYNYLKPHPAAKLILKVFLNDSVAIEKNNKTINCILKSININESNNKLILQRLNSISKESTFQVQVTHLVDLKFRRIHVSPAGRIIDNGNIYK